MSPVTSRRVRFAPSPTGYLHIGGVRTALFNWLWARKSPGGKFILRIEDTDQERSTLESRQIILDSLAWLGLDFDEGPFEQMARLPLYEEWSEKLIAADKAYRCYCTKGELERQREALKARDPKATFRYPGTCRDRRDHPSLPFVVRFKVPTEGTLTYVDKVFGEVTTPNLAQQDFVLLRSDGVPLYNFGAVVDDITMGVTLVARGRDHMVNTPPQIMLYQAFSAPIPEFAHLPMMLAPNGEKLSKRHGAVSVTEYKAQGYAPDAVLNYLARFGWSHGDQEIFSREELVAAFDWEACGRGDGKFDAKKFLAVNHEHLKSAVLTPDETYVVAVLPFLAARGLTVSPEAVRRALPAVRDRARTYIEAADGLDYFFRDEPVMDEKAAAKFLTSESAPHLMGLLDLFTSADPWEERHLHEAMEAWLAEKNLAIKDVAQAARVALTGRTASPQIYQVLVLLGKETSLERLRKGLERAEVRR